MARFAVVASSGDEVPEKNRVAQRRKFGKSSRINLTTRKSSVEKVKNAEIGAKSSGIEFASCVLMAAFDRLASAGELIRGKESLASGKLAVKFAVATAAPPIPVGETQLPSASQNRPRQTCRIDHGSQPSQTNPTMKNRVHLDIPRIPWMTI